MPNFSETKELSYTARQIYDLVIDIEKYPEFVPWCSKCIIIEQKENEILADLEVSFGIVSKSYRSKIIHGFDDNSYFIKIDKVSGQFKRLKTEWNFKKKGTFNCIVDFLIDFELESVIANAMVGNLFGTASKMLVKAFEDRARSVYGGG